MNQEEWLAERRRLGLPADPAKDFPPQYREEPHSAARRFAANGAAGSPRVARQAPASTHRQPPPPQPQQRAVPGPPPGWAQGPSTAPGVPAPPGPRPPQGARTAPVSTTRMRVGTRRTKGRGWIALIAVVAVAILGPTGNSLSHFVGSLSSGTGTSDTSSDDVFGGADDFPDDVDDATDAGGLAHPGDTWDPTDADDDELAAADSARTVMDRFARGDAAVAKRLVKKGSADTRALTAATAKLAMGPSASFGVDDVTVLDPEADARVSGTLSTSSGDVPVTLALTRGSSDEDWAVAPFDWPRLSFAAPVPQAITLNGQKLDLRTANTVELPLATWPGKTTVKLAKDPFTTWSKDTLTESHVDGIGPSAYVPATLITAKGERTAAFEKQAKAAAQANLDRCLASKTLALSACPFRPSGSTQITKTSGLKYTLTSKPGAMKISGPLGREQLSASGGSVSISGRGLYQGSWATLQGSLGLSVNGLVFVKDGKVTFSQF